MSINSAMSPLRRRNCFLILGFIVIVPFSFFVLLSVPDATTEQILVQRLVQLQFKLQYLDSIYRTRQEDVQKLIELIDIISIPSIIWDNSSSIMPKPIKVVKPDIKHMIKNMSGMNAAQGLYPLVMLKLPSSYHFLPHLLDDPFSLRLPYLLSKGRTGVSLVIGIPTVKREKRNYLMETLQNLISGMTPEETNDTLIVVFVAETDLEDVLQVANEIEIRQVPYFTQTKYPRK